MQPVKRGPPSPAIDTEEADIAQVVKAEEKRVKIDSPRVQESLETCLQAKNGIANPPPVGTLPKQKHDVRDMLKLLVSSPRLLETFDLYMSLSSAQFEKYALANQIPQEGRQELLLFSERGYVITDLIKADCKAKMQNVTDDWQMQIVLKESMLEHELSPAALALLNFLFDLSMVLFLDAAISDPFLEQEGVLSTVRLLLKHHLYESIDTIVEAVKALPQKFFAHLIEDQVMLRMHGQKKELFIRLSALPSDYLVGHASSLLLYAQDKKAFELFSKKFAVHSSSLAKDLHAFITTQDPRSQDLLLNAFLEEIEGLLNRKAIGKR